jgi:2-iminobutanoate/2-iminopropanoate deaminase
MKKEIIATENAPKAIGPYSQGTKSGGLIFVSGQLPVNAATGEFPVGGIEEQAKQSLKNVKAVLEAGGSCLENVLKTTVFLQDIKDFAAFNAVYAEFFKTDCPARSCIQIAALPKGALVEVEAIAAV